MPSDPRGVRGKGVLSISSNAIPFSRHLANRLTDLTLTPISRTGAPTRADITKLRRRFGFLTELGELMRRAVLRSYSSEAIGNDRFPSEYTGALGNSFTARVVDEDADESRVYLITTSPYAQFIEGGRGPGGVDREAIREWAINKLGVDDPREVRAIARHIATEGIKPRLLIARTFNLAPRWVSPSYQQFLADVKLLMRRYFKLARKD